MRVYVMITGVLFGLLVAAHVWRMFAEDPHLATSPPFIAITAVAAGLCLWAARLVIRSNRT